MTRWGDVGLEELTAAVAGIDLWNTPGIPKAGLAPLRVTDGPNGARGPSFTGVPSACFPCGSALGATWDPELVGRVGTAIGEEARTKGAHVLLAPTVNLHRHPLAGRNFECYSEDPTLTAMLAIGFVRGVQSTGVGVTVKHFVANDSEFERMTISSDVDEGVLRELYLVPFEAAVTEAGAWGIMSAYNKVNGTYCSEHPWLLTTVLRDEWGFDGFVVSDWFGTHSTAPAANAGLDLEMPGPPQWFGRALADAVTTGTVARTTVEHMVERLHLLGDRTGANAGDGGGAPGSVDDPAHRALIREAAAASFVLLRNEGDLLPLDREGLGSVAIIGTAADTTWVMGGGSAALDPHPAVSPRAGLEAALAGGPTVTFARGPAATSTIPVLNETALAGRLSMDVFASTDLTGEPAISTTLRTARAMWLGDITDAVDPRAFSARLHGAVRVAEPGDWTFGLTATGACRVVLDGEVLFETGTTREPGTSFFGFGSAEQRATRTLATDRDHELLIEFTGGSPAKVSGLELGAVPPTPATALADAAAVAAAADVAIVVVGTGPTLDTEGADRPDLHLSGEQDAMVRAIAAAQPNTVVCVNAGSPVAMDWADDVPTVLQCWLPGEEWGNSLADVLLGEREPGGRLPTTLPVRLEDAPAHPTYPGSDGHVEYADGFLMGYRGYDRAGTEPRFCFGHGLAYTTFEYDNLAVDGRRVTVDVANTGTRDGSEVVQLYVERVDGPADRPVRQLRRFAKVGIAAGTTRTVAFELDDRAFAEWHDGWVIPDGEFAVAVGRSSRDLRATAPIRA
ncbi:MAG: beta-glucosidase H [Acidimicrobiia bacterium]